VRILGKSLKIREKSVETWANSLTKRAKMAPNVFDLKKMGPKSHEDLSSEKRAKMAKSHRHWPKFAQKWPKKFLGKFAEIRTKILPTPQVCLLLHQWVKLQPNYVKVSTPGSSTYVLNFSVFLLLTFCHLW